MSSSLNGRPPVAVLVLCGKRKSGKDFVANKLSELLGGEEAVSVLRLSKPLKAQYAKDHGLDLERLMDSSGYKETYRKAMIVWGEEMRHKDPGYFCRLATEEADKLVWLVCDARRTTDMDYFKKHYGQCAITVRVEASEAVRLERGWTFTPGVDDAESECGLDQYSCDIVITNNDIIGNDVVSGSPEKMILVKQLDVIVKMVKEKMQTI